jgi:hypothetical protein
MAYEALSVDLKLNITNVEWKWDELGVVEEPSKFWWMFEIMPFKRLAYDDGKGYYTWWYVM